MRLFFCAELDSEVRRALAEVSRRFRAVLGEGSWVPPENYHLTVRFLGEAAEEALPRLLEVGRGAAAEAVPFVTNLEVPGGFPQARAARLLWVGPAAEVPEHRRLCQRVERAVQALGFAPEKRQPVPHVTLARFKSPRDLRPLLGRERLDIPPARVEALTLMRSALRPEGALYTPLARWKFGGGDGV